MRLLLILIHTIYGIHILLSNRPPNLFSTLKIPLNASTDAIRAKLLHESSTSGLSPELEDLLLRLSSVETRSLYPRFGHKVLMSCIHCRSADDFALFAMPRAALSYIAEIAFIGLTTFHRRKLSTIILIMTAFAELYVLATTTIRIPQRGTNYPVIMWHDVLLSLRRVVFTLLPPLIHFIPTPVFRVPLFHDPHRPNAKTQSEIVITLLRTRQTLSHLLPALHLLKYAQAATMRVPVLRVRAGRWWEEEALVGALIRSDDDGPVSVRGLSRALDISFDNAQEGREDGKMLTSSRAAVRALMAEGIKVSEHWKPPT